MHYHSLFIQNHNLRDSFLVKSQEAKLKSSHLTILLPTSLKETEIATDEIKIWRLHCHSLLIQNHNFRDIFLIKSQEAIIKSNHLTILLPTSLKETEIATD